MEFIIAKHMIALANTACIPGFFTFKPKPPHEEMVAALKKVNDLQYLGIA
jgi:hypothetical protein